MLVRLPNDSDMLFREFLHRVPFLRLLLPFILGIILAEYFYVKESIVIISIALAFSVLVLFQLIPLLRKSYSYSVVFGFFVFILCLNAGFLRLNQSNASMQLPSSDSITAFKGSLKRSPDEKPNSMACVFELNAICWNQVWQKSNARVLLYLAKDSLSKSLCVGDVLVISSKLDRVKNNGNPYEFDYAKYLQHRYILYSAYVRNKSWRLLEKNKGSSLKSMAVAWRQKLLNIYKKTGLRNEAYEILAALTLGAREEVSSDVKTVWTAAGATHVLAVSGLHVGIIFGIMQFILSFLAGSKLGRFFRGLILIASLWLYALLTGMSPSVMRAACMFSFLAIGLMINRRGTIYNSLAISAFLLLLIDPFVLFEVGFQFSYLAVVSIVFFQPRFEKLIEVHQTFLRWSWKLFTVSLAAQVGTFPLAIYYFHQFPSYFFLSNFVIIPVAGLLIYGSALLLIFSEISFLAKAFTYLLQHFIELIHWLIYQIQVLPGALIEHITFSPLQVVLIYAIITGMTVSLWWNRKKAFLLSLIFLIAFKLVSVSNLYSNQQAEMIVFNSNKHSVVCFRDQQNVLVLSDTVLDEKMKRRLVFPYGIAKRVKNYHYEVLRDNEVRVIGDKVIAIAGKGAHKKVLDELNPDYLILRDNAFRNTSDLTEYKSKVLIRDASNYRQKPDVLVPVLNRNTWDTRILGACVIQFNVE